VQVSQLSSRKSATVVIRAFGIMAAIIDVAVKDRRIPLNPASGVNLPRKRGQERHYLSHAQVQLLADESRGNDTLVLFLAYTGLRWGEAVGLRILSVDMARRRVLVQSNAVNVRGRIVPGTPKSHEARSVSFPAFLLRPSPRRRRARSTMHKCLVPEPSSSPRLTKKTDGSRVQEGGRRSLIRPFRRQ
jgi:integrase